MSVDEMRKRLKICYIDSKSWSARVDRMNDNQIYAIYMRIFSRKQATS